MQSNADFFTDAPLPHCMDCWRAESQALFERMTRWAGHEIASVNGHLVWRRHEDIQPEDGRVFYDGDYSDVLAPDDPRILIPRFDCADLPSRQPHLSWDD